MALPKPQASKAPAPVSDYSGSDFTGLNTPITFQVGAKAARIDPCCIPAGVETGSSVNGSSNAKDDATFWGQQGALGAIVNPTAH